MRRIVHASCVVVALSACSGGSATPHPDSSVVTNDVAPGSDIAPVTDTGTDASVSDVPISDASGMDVPTTQPTITISHRINTFDTQHTMFAAVEMQQSGEPLAQDMGRNLAGYYRYDPTPNQYFDPSLVDAGTGVIDLVGWATAIESYEYSKQPMNNLAFESGAGVSLAFGPLDNPTNVTGAAALTALTNRVQHYGISSHAGFEPIPDGDGGLITSSFVVVPPPTANPLNPMGWSGFWPTFHPFRSFDPTISPATGATRGCNLVSGYAGSTSGQGGSLNTVGDYECGYSTLHILAREDPSSTDKTITPGVSGWSNWKWAFWIINYTQIMHDLNQNPIQSVPDGQLAMVGNNANSVLGVRMDTGMPSDAGPGTYLGSSDIEGFQGAFMIDAVDNQAWHWLAALTTTDGSTLSGFASCAAALAYDYNSPLRWFPGAISLTENVHDLSGFPAPTAYHLQVPDSTLMDQLGLLGGFAEVYSVTDRNNTTVGGAQADLAYFDGDPFPSDNGMPDGENTLHDHALGMMKVAFVNLDRLHRDPTSGLLADSVTFAGATPTRATTLSTLNADYVIVTLRTLRRSLSSNLTLYSNSTPDTAVSGQILDSTSFTGSPGGANMTARINALIQAHADLVYNSLTAADGSVRMGWDFTASAAMTADGDVEAYAAAVRALLESYLATGNTMYRDRAELVFAHMTSEFYDASARLWRSTSDPTAPVSFTPQRFALIEAMLREYYKLDASRTGHEAEAATVQDYLQRLIKLVLNGWDDRNQDGIVQESTECIYSILGVPAGGLQLAERALTGETGLDPASTPLHPIPSENRDHDCVPEISGAFLPSALGTEVDFTITP